MPTDHASVCANQTSERLAGISKALGGPYQLVCFSHPAFRQASNTLPGLVGSAQRRRRGGSGLRCTSSASSARAVYQARAKWSAAARKAGRPEATHAQNTDNGQASKRALVGGQAHVFASGPLILRHQAPISLCRVVPLKGPGNAATPSRSPRTGSFRSHTMQRVAPFLPTNRT